MRTLVYSTRTYDQEYMEAANHNQHELHYTSTRLEERTAVLAKDYPAVCCFVDDNLNAQVLQLLTKGGTKLVALRSTGFNNIDLKTADKLGITVMRVSRYSPNAVAEFAVGMILTLNRHIHKAYVRVREGNFLLDGLMGFDLEGKTIGVVGTGKIGAIFARIIAGFGCQLLGYDIKQNEECLSLGMRYVSLKQLLGESDIVSLHAPLTPQTHYLINTQTISYIKPGLMLINTSRGALIDTKALIPALKKGVLGAVGLDVYEEEADIYFQNLSDEIIADDIITRLLTFPNVLITGHQAFFTREAITIIAETTIRNISDFAAGLRNENIVEPKNVLATSINQ